MKRLVKIFLLICASFVFFTMSMTVRATEERQEYSVRHDGEEYVLSLGSTQIMRTGVFSELINYCEDEVNGERVVFYDTEISESFIVRGKATFGGRLTIVGGARIIVDGGELHLRGASICFESGGFDIRRGSVVFENGSVTSDGVAFDLSFSASSLLEIIAGNVESAGVDCAIRNHTGTVKIGGGSVRCGGVAIENEATLVLTDVPTLDGEMYDVSTDKAIELFDGNKIYNGTARVKFCEKFEVGTSTKAMLIKTESSIDGITIYDNDGTKMNLSVFSGGTLECDYAAVYLPYKITFYNADAEFFTEYALYGEQIRLPEEPKKKGYSFIGWCDNDGSLYDFATPIRNDVKLYAAYKLALPAFSVSSVKEVYSGDEYFVAIEQLTHEIEDEGYFSFAWYKDGVPLQVYSQSCGVRYAADSGTYTCRITFTTPHDTVSVSTPPISVLIEKQKVQIPRIASKKYNGEIQKPDVVETSVYSVSYSDKICRAGIYPVYFILKDTDNYEFSSGSDSVTVDFIIEKAENYWIESPSINDFYTGSTPYTRATARFGTPKFLFADAKEGIYTDGIPSAAGEYYLIVRVDGCSDYFGLESEAIPFTVILEEVVGIAINTPPNKLNYTAFEKIVTDGITVSATYNSGRCEVVGAEYLTFEYLRSDCFLYTDIGVNVLYCGKSVLLRVNVERAEYDISNISFFDKTEVYDGSYKTIEILQPLPVGLDGIPLTATVIGGGYNASVYTVTARFFTESENYRVPDELSAQLTVSPYACDVIWQDIEFVYDGGSKKPTAYCIDVYDRKTVLDVVGERSFAGTYTAQAILNDGNYVLLNPTAQFVIKKGEYDMSCAVWCGGGETYDGSEKTVYLTSLPQGVRAVGYVNNTFCEAGTYYADAVFSYDDMNYNEPRIPVYEWSILRAEYDCSLFDFLDGEFVYDGNVRYPVIEGQMPCGADGIYLRYAFEGGVSDVPDSGSSVKIVFMTDSKNYNIPPSVYRKVYLSPKEIEVEWQGMSEVYNGYFLSPRAYSEYTNITVTGGGVNAGKYEVYATSNNPNYKVANDKCEFIIERADNSWLIPPSVENVFYGGELTIDCLAKAGQVRTEFYRDADCTDRLDGVPHGVGTYYLIVICDGDLNYKPISSGVLAFEIIPIVAISLEADFINTNFYAFEKLTKDDLAVKLVNNDGSRENVDLSRVEIEYENGESFRFGDDVVRLSCSGFSIEYPIEVRKATYDLTGIGWQGIDTVYDGSVKHATLTGLPDGVSVIEYVGNDNTDAGEYRVGVILSYDEYNYVPPRIDDAVMKIRKREIPVPSIPPCVYDGAYHAPDITHSSLYAFDEFGEVREVGRYAIRVSLRDSINYIFTGDVTETIVDFVIEKRKITVFVDNVELYLFQNKAEPTYTITDGELLDGDALDLRFSISGERVVGYCDSPHYDVTFVGGDVIRHSYLSLSARVRFIFLSVFILAVVVIAVALVTRRRRCVSIVCTHMEGENIQDTKPQAESKPSQQAASDAQPPLQVGEIEKKNEIDTKCSFIALQPTPSVASGENVQDAPNERACSGVDAEYADTLISNSLAKDLVRHSGHIVTEGNKKGIINVDTLSSSFRAGDTVDVNILKSKSLIPYDTAYIKVLARGVIDKPLYVYANDFSLSAVKMIALTGGRAIKVNTYTDRAGYSIDKSKK